MALVVFNKDTFDKRRDCGVEVEWSSDPAYTLVYLYLTGQLIFFLHLKYWSPKYMLKKMVQLKHNLRFTKPEYTFSLKCYCDCFSVPFMSQGQFKKKQKKLMEFWPLRGRKSPKQSHKNSVF